jgi:hypothetical protein
MGVRRAPGYLDQQAISQRAVQARTLPRLAVLSGLGEEGTTLKKKILVAGAAAVVGVLALSSGAVAAQHYIITSSSQVKDGSIALRDLTPSARKAMKNTKGTKGARGPQGPAGIQGPAGPQGKPGPAADPKPGKDGVSGYEIRTWRYSKDDANSDMGPGYVGVGSGAIATVACSPGKVALSGGYRFTSPGTTPGDNGFNADAIRNGSGVVASFPGRMDWNTNTVKPNDNSGWIVQVNDKVAAADMTLYVVCANVN